MPSATFFCLLYFFHLSQSSTRQWIFFAQQLEIKFWHVRDVWIGAQIMFRPKLIHRQFAHMKQQLFESSKKRFVGFVRCGKKLVILCMFVCCLKSKFATFIWDCEINCDWIKLLFGISTCWGGNEDEF